MQDNLIRSDGTADPDGFPGRYYASHAEKQLAVTDPDATRVSPKRIIRTGILVVMSIPPLGYLETRFHRDYFISFLTVGSIASAQI